MGQKTIGEFCHIGARFSLVTKCSHQQISRPDDESLSMKFALGSVPGELKYSPNTICCYVTIILLTMLTCNYEKRTNNDGNHT